jgi:osmotically-inducible protein OsmY
MKTSHLILGTLIAVAPLAACNRGGETDETAQRAAGEARAVAAITADRLEDGWLATKVQAQYFADEDVKARFINVSADEGVVTLRGRVDDDRSRDQAVTIARNTDGVREVRDQLLVGPPADSREAREAAWITTQIQARYFSNSAIAGRDIEVSTSNGVVTLTGRVDSEAEKADAVTVARSVEGVARVDDRLVVQPEDPPVATTGTLPSVNIPLAPIDDNRVATSIQARYFLDNTLKGRRIEVDTSQGVVTLRGEVASDDERAQALLLARTTEGAQRVEDMLTVNAALDRQSSSAATPAAPAQGPAPASQSQDAALVKSIQSRLAADKQAAAVMVEVTAKDGVVLVDGMVPNAATKQRILTVVRQTPNVVQVIDRLRIGRSR